MALPDLKLFTSYKYLFLVFVTNIFPLPGDGALGPGAAWGGVAGVWLDHTLLVLGEDGGNHEMYVLYCNVYCTVLYCTWQM